jgi:ABC-type multidrug transport system ATPase subunit
MLVVLGPPGSGCTTFLKTIAGDYNGIFMDDSSYFNYQGETSGFAADRPLRPETWLADPYLQA